MEQSLELPVELKSDPPASRLLEDSFVDKKANLVFLFIFFITLLFFVWLSTGYSVNLSVNLISPWNWFYCKLNFTTIVPYFFNLPRVWVPIYAIIFDLHNTIRRNKNLLLNINIILTNASFCKGVVIVFYLLYLFFFQMCHKFPPSLPLLFHF